jgi:hypothetical protein
LLWYSFQSSHNAAYSISTCPGAAFDTVLTAFDGGCSALQEIACNDDVNCNGSAVRSTIAGLIFGAGQSRFVTVGAYGGATGGTFQIVVTNDLPLGNCCIGAACTLTDAPRCTGVFSAAGLCAPNPCAGACCTGTRCALVALAACSGAFQGAGSVCGPAGNPTTCCPANFNGQGGVSVQDIFDFLAAYFSAAPGADFNHSGAASVQDIFDFLSAYFAGCA